MRRMLLGLIGMLLVLSLPLVARAIDDEALVLYLPFDEGAGENVEDLSGKENHGTIDGNVDWVNAGRLGSALSFNEEPQSGVVIVKPSESLAIEENLTVEAWVNPGSVGDYRNLLGQANPLTYYLSIHQSRPSVWFGTDGAGGQTWVGTEDTIPSDEWSHIAAVWDSVAGELRLYINGELNGTHGMEGKLPINMATDIWIGNRLDGAWPYGGLLDEFVLYNRPLSEAEIQQDMNGQVLAVASQVDRLAILWGSVKELR